MKRIIALILTFINLFSYAVFAKDSMSYDKEFELLSSYNIMVKADSESMNTEITQGQFREALSSIAGENDALMDRIDSFGEVYNASAGVPMIKAVISLVKLVGYDSDAIDAGGTFNMGYMSVASDLGILKGVSLGENDYITYAQAGKLIYNTLEVPLVEIRFAGSDVYYQENEDKTILTEYLNIYEVKGIVNATSDYARTGYSVTPDNIILIGSGEYIISKSDMKEYFGMEITGYYKYDEDAEESTLLKIVPKNEDSVLNLKPRDIENYDAVSGSYTYYKDEIGKEKTAKLAAGVEWFYNYNAVETKQQTESMDFVPEVGSVRLIDVDNDSKYDIVIILSYDTGIVSYTREGFVVTKDNQSKILTDSDTEIVDKNGNPYSSVLDITENSVIHVIYRKDGYTADKIIVVTDIVEGTISEIDVTEMTVSIKDGAAYYVTDKNKAILDELKDNKNVTLYLDINKNIAGYKLGITGDMLYGYLIRFRSYESEENGENVLEISFYDVSEKKIKKLFAAEKIKIDETRYTTNTYSIAVDNFHDEDGVLYDQLIRYKQNSDGEITEIDTAYDGDDNLNPYGIWGFFPAKKEGLVKVAGSQLMKETGKTAAQLATSADEWDRARLTYWVALKGVISKRYQKTSQGVDDWATNLVVSSGATVLYVPKNRNSEGEYYVTTRAAWSLNGQAVLDAYRVENESILPDFLVAYEGNGVAQFDKATSAVNNTSLISSSSHPALVIDIKSVWVEEDDSVAYQMTLLHSGTEKTLLIEHEEWVTTLEYEVKNTNSAKTLGTVKGLHAGDIIRYAESGGSVTAIEMYAPKSMIKNYDMTNWNYLSRGVMNNGGYIGYAYEGFGEAVMAVKVPSKLGKSQSIDFEGADVFMLTGLTIYNYDAKKKKYEKAGTDCINYYAGTKELEETSVIVVFGDGGNVTESCMYVLNSLFK